jgi:hypothetical protein
MPKPGIWIICVVNTGECHGGYQRSVGRFSKTRAALCRIGPDSGDGPARGLTGVFPAHGFTTLYYLVRKHASRPDAEAAMDDVLKHFEVGNLDTAGWSRARSLPMPDFEDAVVAVVAWESGSAFIITRNTGDFTHSPVPAITPDDFLSQFAPP